MSQLFPRAALVACLLLSPLAARAQDKAPAAEKPEEKVPEKPADAAPAKDLVQWGKGPFEIGDPGLMGEIRMTPYMRSPRTLEPGHVEVGARVFDENSYAFLGDRDLTTTVHRITIDGENRDLDLVARVGVLPRIELGVELSALHWRGGGWIDGKLIRNWHRLIEVGDVDRHFRPKNAYLVEGTEPDGRPFSLPGQLTGLGDGSAQARVLALEGGELWPAASITLRAWLPVSNRHFDHARGTAESLTLDLSKRILDLPVFVYASASYTYFDEATVDGLRLSRHLIYGAFGAEWELNEYVSFSVHFMEETRCQRKLYRHTNIAYGNILQYMVFGVKIEPIPGLRIEPGAIEHIYDPSVTGTFGFLLNVWYDFDAGALLKSM